MSLASRSESGIDPPALTTPARPALFTGPFLLLLAMQGAFGFAMSVFVLLPKILAVSFAATPSQIGVVMAAFGVASLVSIPFVARAVVIFDHRRSLVISNLLLALGAFGFLLVTGTGPLAAVLRGLQGLAWSLGFAAGMALVAELAPAARLGQAIGIFGAASLGMTAIGPAIAEPVNEAVGHRPVFLLGALAALGGAALARRLPRLPPLAEAIAAAPRDSDRPGSAPRVAIYLVLGTAALAMGVMFTFLAPFALARGIREIRGFFIAYTLSALAVRILVGPLADRIGHRRLAIASAPIYGLVVVAAGLFGPTQLRALGVGFGIAHGAIFPALMTLLLGDGDRHARARLVGVANGAMNLGLAAVFLVGLGAERIGYPPMFVLAGAVMAATTALLVRAPTLGDDDRQATPDRSPRS